MSDDVRALDEAELSRRVTEVQARMAPLERELAALRAERDVLLTERRRREREQHRLSRAGIKSAMRDGRFPTVVELVAVEESGSLDAYAYNLKTGGEVRLGFPGARSQSLAFTDGKSMASAGDLAEAHRLYVAGWELGSPGRPGVRVHFPGTRQERLAPAEDVFARPVEGKESATR